MTPDRCVSSFCWQIVHCLGDCNLIYMYSHVQYYVYCSNVLHKKTSFLFYRKQALQRHMRYHTGEKPFKCDHCDFVCRESTNLKNHIALHYSQRNYVCELCGAAFYCKRTLQQHHVYKHQEDRNFQCDQCPMTFKASGALKRHMRTHDKDKMHKCPECGVGFHRMYNLRRHMKQVHGSDNILPPVRQVQVIDLKSGEEPLKGSKYAKHAKIISPGKSPYRAPGMPKRHREAMQIAFPGDDDVKSNSPPRTALQGGLPVGQDEVYLATQGLALSMAFSELHSHMPVYQLQAQQANNTQPASPPHHPAHFSLLQSLGPAPAPAPIQQMSHPHIHTSHMSAEHA